MCKLYMYQTPIGPFFIAYSRGLYRLLFENESLGSYGTIEQAAQDIGGRERFLVTGGVDTKSLSIPANLDFWENCFATAASA
jgi:hypothetical protein